MNSFKVRIRYGELVTKINKAISISTSGNKPDDLTVIHALSPSTIQKGNLMGVECTYVNDDLTHNYYEITIPNKNIGYMYVYAPDNKIGNNDTIYFPL